MANIGSSVAGYEGEFRHGSVLASRCQLAELIPQVFCLVNRIDHIASERGGDDFGGLLVREIIQHMNGYAIDPQLLGRHPGLDVAQYLKCARRCRPYNHRLNDTMLADNIEQPRRHSWQGSFRAKRAKPELFDVRGPSHQSIVSLFESRDTFLADNGLCEVSISLEPHSVDAWLLGRRTGRLAQMTKDDNPLPDHERIRLGRLVFDGADRLQLANRLGLSTEDIHDAWLFCRQQLSRHFADAAGTAYRLLDDQELRERSVDCLRLLLDWRESLLVRERTKDFGAGCSKDVGGRDEAADVVNDS